MHPPLEDLNLLPLSCVLDALEDPAWVCDAAGTHFLCNRPLQQLLGPHFDLQVLAQHLAPEHQQETERAFSDHFANGERFSLQFPLHLPPGEQWMELRVSPMQQVGERRGWLGVFRPLNPAATELEALLEHAPVGLGLIGPDNRMKVLNQVVVEGTPHTREAFLQHPLAELYPETFPLLEPVLNQVRESGQPAPPLEFEARYPRAGRPNPHWRVLYFPVHSKGGQLLGVGSVTEDIRQLRDTEKQLAEQQAFLQGVLNVLPAGVTVRDLQTNQLLLGNTELARVVGYTPEELAQLPLSELVFPEDLENFLGHIRQISQLTKGEVAETELRMRHKDGSERWLHGRSVVYQWDGQGKPLVSINTSIDITGRVRAERQLREQELHFQTVAQSAPVLLWMLDATLNLTFLNPAWFEFTGLAESDPAGWIWQRSIHPEDVQGMEQLIQQAWQNQQMYETTFRLRHHSGEYRWMMARALPHHNSAGEFQGFVGGTVDIHDQVVAREQLRERELELEEMLRREKQFLRDAAHEFRTPLAVLQGNIDLLLRHRDLPRTERLEILSEVQWETLRLSRMINEMLMLARGDMGLEFREEEVKLTQLLREVWEDVKLHHPHHRFVWGEVAEVQVWGDPERLVQLLGELLGNATKYTGAGGEIRADLKPLAEGVELRITDSGVGIPAGDLERVFERFYRVDPSRQREPGSESTGLGLPIARWIVEKHDGKIWLESREGHGTTAIVHLPFQL